MKGWAPSRHIIHTISQPNHTRRLVHHDDRQAASVFNTPDEPVCLRISGKRRPIELRVVNAGDMHHRISVQYARLPRPSPCTSLARLVRVSTQT